MNFNFNEIYGQFTIEVPEIVEPPEPLIDQNELTFSWKVDIGESLLEQSAQVYIPESKDFNAQFSILCNETLDFKSHLEIEEFSLFNSEVYIANQNDLSSNFSIPFWTEVDLDYNLIQIPVTQTKNSAIKDTFTKFLDEANNFGNSYSLICTEDIFSTRTYLEFDLTETFETLNNSTEVRKITLDLSGFVLYQYKIQQLKIFIYEPKWDEHGLTWLSQEAIDENNFILLDGEVSERQVQYDITSLILAYKNTNKKRLSIIIAPVNKTSNLEFYSRETIYKPSITVHSRLNSWTGYSKEKLFKSQFTILPYKDQQSNFTIVKEFNLELNSSLTFEYPLKSDNYSDLRSNLSITNRPFYQKHSEFFSSLSIFNYEYDDPFTVQNFYSQFFLDGVIFNDSNENILSSAYIDGTIAGLPSDNLSRIFIQFDSAKDKQSILLILTNSDFESQVTLYKVKDVNSEFIIQDFKSLESTLIIIPSGESFLNSKIELINSYIPSNINLLENKEIDSQLIVVFDKYIESYLKIDLIPKDLESEALIEKFIFTDLNSNIDIINTYISSEINVVYGADENIDSIVYFRALVNNDIDSTLTINREDLHSNLYIKHTKDLQSSAYLFDPIDNFLDSNITTINPLIESKGSFSIFNQLESEVFIFSTSESILDSSLNIINSFIESKMLIVSTFILSKTTIHQRQNISSEVLINFGVDINFSASIVSIGSEYLSHNLTIKQEAIEDILMLVKLDDSILHETNSSMELSNLVNHETNSAFEISYPANTNTQSFVKILQNKQIWSEIFLLSYATSNLSGIGKILSSSDLYSSLNMPFRDELVSQLSIPEYYEMDTIYDLIQIPLYTTEFDLIKDSFTWLSRPYKNFGDSKTIELSPDSDSSRNYFTFSLEKIKDLLILNLDEINKIYVEFKGIYSFFPKNSVSIYQTTDQWDEYAITWEAQPTNISFVKETNFEKGYHDTLIIDITEYVKTLIDNLLKGLITDTSFTLLFKPIDKIEVLSKESSIPPKLKMIWRDPNWSGTYVENDIDSSMSIIGYNEVDFISRFKIEQISDQNSISLFEKTNNQLNSEIVILRLDKSIEGIAEFEFPNKELQAELLIQQTKEEDVFSSFFIPHADILSETKISITNSLDSQVNLTEEITLDLTSQFSLIGSYFESKIVFVSPEDINSSFVIRVEDKTFIESQALIELMYNEINASAIFSFPRVDEDIDSQAALSASFIENTVLIVSTSDINASFQITKGSEEDIESSMKVRRTYESISSILSIKPSEDLHSKVDFWKSKEIYSKIDFINSFLSSEVLISEMKTLDLESSLDIFRKDVLFPSQFTVLRKNDFYDIELDAKVEIINASTIYSKVFIREIEEVQSDLIIKQEDEKGIQSKFTFAYPPRFPLILDTTPPQDFQASIDFDGWDFDIPYATLTISTTDTNISDLQVKFEGIGFNVILGTPLPNEGDGWYKYQSTYRLYVPQGQFYLKLTCRDSVWNTSPNVPTFRKLVPFGNYSPSFELNLDTTAPECTVILNNGLEEIYTTAIKIEYHSSSTDCREFRIWGDFSKAEPYPKTEEEAEWLPYYTTTSILNSVCEGVLGFKRFYVAFRDDVFNEIVIEKEVEYKAVIVETDDEGSINKTMENIIIPFSDLFISNTNNIVDFPKTDKPELIDEIFSKKFNSFDFLSSKGNTVQQIKVEQFYSSLHLINKVNSTILDSSSADNEITTTKTSFTDISSSVEDAFYLPFTLSDLGSNITTTNIEIPVSHQGKGDDLFSQKWFNSFEYGITKHKNVNIKTNVEQVSTTTETIQNITFYPFKDNGEGTSLLTKKWFNSIELFKIHNEKTTSILLDSSDMIQSIEQQSVELSIPKIQYEFLDYISYFNRIIQDKGELNKQLTSINLTEVDTSYVDEINLIDFSLITSPISILETVRRAFLLKDKGLHNTKTKLDLPQEDTQHSLETIITSFNSFEEISYKELFYASKDFKTVDIGSFCSNILVYSTDIKNRDISYFNFYTSLVADNYYWNSDYYMYSYDKSGGRNELSPIYNDILPEHFDYPIPPTDKELYGKNLEKIHTIPHVTSLSENILSFNIENIKELESYLKYYSIKEVTFDSNSPEFGHDLRSISWEAYNNREIQYTFEVTVYSVLSWTPFDTLLKDTFNIYSYYYDNSFVLEYPPYIDPIHDCRHFYHYATYLGSEIDIHNIINAFLYHKYTYIYPNDNRKYALALAYSIKIVGLTDYSIKETEFKGSNNLNIISPIREEEIPINRTFFPKDFRTEIDTLKIYASFDCQTFKKLSFDHLSYKNSESDFENFIYFKINDPYENPSKIIDYNFIISGSLQQSNSSLVIEQDNKINIKAEDILNFTHKEIYGLEEYFFIEKQMLDLEFYDFSTTNSKLNIELSSNEQIKYLEWFGKEFNVFYKANLCENILIYSHKNMLDRDILYFFDDEFEGRREKNPLYGLDQRPTDKDYPYTEENPKYGTIIPCYNTFSDNIDFNEILTNNVETVYTFGPVSGISKTITGFIEDISDSDVSEHLKQIYRINFYVGMLQDTTQLVSSILSDRSDKIDFIIQCPDHFQYVRVAVTTTQGVTNDEASYTLKFKSDEVILENPEYTRKEYINVLDEIFIPQDFYEDLSYVQVYSNVGCNINHTFNLQGSKLHKFITLITDNKPNINKKYMVSGSQDYTYSTTSLNIIFEDTFDLLTEQAIISKAFTCISKGLGIDQFKTIELPNLDTSSINEKAEITLALEKTVNLRDQIIKKQYVFYEKAGYKESLITTLSPKDILISKDSSVIELLITVLLPLQDIQKISAEFKFTDRISFIENLLINMPLVDSALEISNPIIDINEISIHTGIDNRQDKSIEAKEKIHGVTSLYSSIPVEESIITISENSLNVVSIDKAVIYDIGYVEKRLYNHDYAYVCEWLQIEKYEYDIPWLQEPVKNPIIKLPKVEETTHTTGASKELKQVSYYRNSNCDGEPEGGWPPIRPVPNPPNYIDPTPEGGLIIYKYDGRSNNPISGWEMTITNLTTGKTYIESTNWKGYLQLKDIPTGQYLVKEQMPDGWYTPDTDTKIIDLNTYNNTPLSFTNYPYNPSEPPTPPVSDKWEPDPDNPPDGWELDNEGNLKPTDPGWKPDPVDPGWWKPNPDTDFNPDEWIPHPSDPGKWKPNPDNPPVGWKPNPDNPDNPDEWIPETPDGWLPPKDPNDPLLPDPTKPPLGTTFFPYEDPRCIILRPNFLTDAMRVGDPDYPYSPSHPLYGQPILPYIDSLLESGEIIRDSSSLGSVITIPRVKGTITIHYNNFESPDRISVSYKGEKIYTTVDPSKDENDKYKYYVTGEGDIVIDWNLTDLYEPSNIYVSIFSQNYLKTEEEKELGIYGTLTYEFISKGSQKNPLYTRTASWLREYMREHKLPNECYGGVTPEPELPEYPDTPDNVYPQLPDTPGPEEGIVLAPSEILKSNDTLIIDISIKSEIGQSLYHHFFAADMVMELDDIKTNLQTLFDFNSKEDFKFNFKTISINLIKTFDTNLKEISSNTSTLHYDYNESSVKMKNDECFLDLNEKHFTINETKINIKIIESEDEINT